MEQRIFANRESDTLHYDFEATKLINQFSKSSQLVEPWIIACTANASEADFKKCFESGMKDYLSKPFTKKDLIIKLDSYYQLQN